MHTCTITQMRHGTQLKTKGNSNHLLLVRNVNAQTAFSVKTCRGHLNSTEQSGHLLKLRPKHVLLNKAPHCAVHNQLRPQSKDIGPKCFILTSKLPLQYIFKITFILFSFLAAFQLCSGWFVICICVFLVFLVFLYLFCWYSTVAAIVGDLYLCIILSFLFLYFCRFVFSRWYSRFAAPIVL